MLKSIGRHLGKIGPFNIRCFVVLLSEPKTAEGYNENSKFHKNKPFRRYVSGNKDSLSMEYMPFLQLDYFNPAFHEKAYYKDYRFNIPYYQVGKFIKLLKKTFNIIEKYGKTLFYIDGDTSELKMYAVDSKKDLEKVCVCEYGFIGGRSVTTVPSIVTDNRNYSYEGVRFVFDKSNHDTYITYEELDSLLYVLSSTDFLNLSQAMINSSIIFYNNGMRDIVGVEDTFATAVQGNASHMSVQTESPQLKNSGMQNVFSGLVQK